MVFANVGDCGIARAQGFQVAIFRAGFAFRGFMAVLLCIAMAEAQARPAPPPGVRADLQRELALLDSARDLIAGVIAEVSSPALDGRRTMLIDVSQVFQGTLWRGQHTVQWVPAAKSDPVPPTGTRIMAFVTRDKDGMVSVAANDVFADNPENRAIASVRYVRIGRNDRSLEVLLVAGGVALALVAVFALRQRRRSTLKPDRS